MARVPRPDQLIVGNHIMSISWLTMEEWYRRDFDDGKDGLTYCMRQEMYIRLVADRPETVYQEVLLHEIQHAVWDTCGYSLVDGWNLGEAHEVEENAILMTSPALLRMMKDNPEVMRYLTSDGHHRR